MREFAREFRIAARTLLKQRGFTATAVLTLAFGIALNIVAFAVVNAYLVRSLPYPAAKRLYNVTYAAPGQDHPRNMESLDWPSLADVIEYPIAWDLDMFYLIGGEHAENAPGAWVTPGFVEGLGIRPAVGRSFLPEEFDSGVPQVALISHSLWQNRFGGDAGIVGRRFEAYVSDRPQEAEGFTIIGVLPAGFWHVNPYTEILAPLRAPSYPYMLRVREHVPVGEVESRITQLVRGGVKDLPRGWQVQLASTQGQYAARIRPVVLAACTAAGMVLLIACANVAFLLLIRATRRHKEIAVRIALGARRSDIARMLTAEGLALGLAATGIGLVLTWLALDWLGPIVQEQLGRPAPGGTSSVTLDWTVLAAAVGCCILAALVFTLAPLLVSLHTNLTQAMQTGMRAGLEGHASRRARSLLIVFEVAAALSLLVGCGLMVRTVARMVDIDFGVETKQVFSTGLVLRHRSYPDENARLGFYERLIPRLSEVPGVKSVALADWWVLQQPRSQTIHSDAAGGAATVQTAILSVSPRYFEAIGIPILQGRSFAASDRAGSEPVALVSQTLAQRLWSGQAVGKRLLVPRRSEGRTENQPARVHTVIGIVQDVRQTHTDEDLADLYMPLLQAPGRFTSVYLRTRNLAGPNLDQIRLAVREIDGEIPINRLRSLQVFVDEQLARPRFLGATLAGLGVFAGIVAVIGIYGVIAYAVRQREHEIAVRVAVGADPSNVTLLFLRQGAQVLGLGILAGAFGSTAIGKTLESVLFGVHSSDPSTVIVVSLLFATAGIAAIWLPARRAAHTDPASALREQ